MLYKKYKKRKRSWNLSISL